MEKYTLIYFILRYRERESRAKEITEIGYVTVTFQENTSDAGLADTCNLFCLLIKCNYMFVFENIDADTNKMLAVNTQISLSLASVIDNTTSKVYVANYLRL
jgi:hypothetical protein